MTPPRWVDTDGHPLRTRPCLRCGTPLPSSAMTVEDVRRDGWIIYMPTIVVHWCGAWAGAASEWLAGMFRSCDPLALAYGPLGEDLA